MSFLTAFISLSPWPKIKQNGGQILRMPFGLIEFLFRPESIRIGAKRIPSWQVSIWSWAACVVAAPEEVPCPAGVAFDGEFWSMQGGCASRSLRYFDAGQQLPALARKP
jgi:hypothetical protein